MIIKHLARCRRFRAGDGSALRELLNPKKDRRLKIHYSLAWASVAPGKRTRAHTLTGSEVYYLLRGRGIMHIDGHCCRLKTGDAVYIPPRSVQFIENTGSEILVFLCFVDPAWTPACEKIL